MDLGGTKIVVALVTLDGAIVGRREIHRHQAFSPARIVERIASAVAAVEADVGIERHRLSGVGVGTSGHVDRAAGRVIRNSQLRNLDGFGLRDALADALGVAVHVDNDANTAAYAEHRFGAARGVGSSVFVTVSTGIGAGIVVAGRLYHGAAGPAGEIGHTIVEPSSPLRCGCGNYGCLMGVASGSALPQVVRRKLSRPGVTTSLNVTGLEDRDIDGELIADALAANDPLAVEIVSEYADYLGIGLYNTFQTLNPEVIVLGGGLTNWGDPYIERARARFYHLGAAMMAKRTEIRIARLGDDAAVVGAAALTLEPA